MSAGGSRPGSVKTFSSHSPAAVAAIRHRVRTGRYRVAPELIAESMVSDAGLVRWVSAIVTRHVAAGERDPSSLERRVACRRDSSLATTVTGDGSRYAGSARRVPRREQN